MNVVQRAFWPAVVLLLVVPVAHPLLIPVVGVPSHLLWWVHVLPVAMITYRVGRRGAAGALAVSAVLVVLGERTFGAGYGVAADWATVWSLTVALTFSNVLVAGFALYARQTARRYQLLFDAAQMGVVRTDADLRILAANPAALELIECPWGKVKDQRMDWVPPLAPLPAPRSLEAEGWTGTLQVGPPGQQKEVHVVVAAVSQSDPPGWQVLLVDRTHEVAQERELDRQAHLATLGEALAGVAHELKNPLSVILSWADMGREPETGEEEMREGYELIADQAERMDGLVQELLGYSRGRSDVGSAPVHEIVERVVRMQRVARKGRVQLDGDIAWHGTLQVSASKLEQVLVNLVSNAADAVESRTGIVEIGLEKVGEEVVISVKDDGPGIPEELLERIFEPFVTTKAEGEGTGLGLAISRRLVQTMGGRLTASNAPDEGAMFAIRLPALLAPVRDEERPPAPVKGVPA